MKTHEKLVLISFWIFVLFIPLSLFVPHFSEKLLSNYSSIGISANYELIVDLHFYGGIVGAVAFFLIVVPILYTATCWSADNGPEFFDNVVANIESPNAYYGYGVLLLFVLLINGLFTFQQFNPYAIVTISCIIGLLDRECFDTPRGSGIGMAIGTAASLGIVFLIMHGCLYLLSGNSIIYHSDPHVKLVHASRLAVGLVSIAGINVIKLSDIFEKSGTVADYVGAMLSSVFIVSFVDVLFGFALSQFMFDINKISIFGLIGALIGLCIPLGVVLIGLLHIRIAKKT